MEKQKIQGLDNKKKYYGKNQSILFSKNSLNRKRKFDKLRKFNEESGQIKISVIWSLNCISKQTQPRNEKT